MMKYLFLPLGLLFTCRLMAQPSPGEARIIYRDSFEAATPDEGAPIRVLNSTSGRIEPVSSRLEPAAATAAGANTALVLEGGVRNVHPWQPSADIALPDLKNGFLYIGFQLKNASLDASVLGIQISHNQPDVYQLWQQMRLNPGHINLSGTGRGLGKEELSSGAGAKWIRVEWIVPTPGNTRGVPRLLINGKDQGAIELEPMTENIPQINLLRFWMADRRGEDTKFLIDQLVVAAAPTLEELAKLVKAESSPRLP